MKSELAFLLAHEYLLNPSVAVGFCLYKAVKGAGTDDDMMVILTALFSDYFKGDAIVKAYEGFGNVVKDLKGDLSGKYEDVVLAMWGLDKK